MKLSHLFSLVLLAGALPAGINAQTILVSQSSAAIAGDAVSSSPDLSSDARYLVFSSDASTLVADDTNSVADIFLHDQQSLQPNAGTDTPATTIRISVSNEGVQANGPSRTPRISEDGRWVVFSSTASNLVSGDTNGSEDIFLYDRLQASIRRISVPITIFGVESGEANGDSVTPSISSDGCYIAYASDATNLQAQGQDGSPLVDSNGKRDIFLYTNPAGTDCQVTDASVEFLSISSSGAQANGDSSLPSVGSIRYVGFVSEATNLVDDDSNSSSDVFVRDRAVSIGDGRVTLLVSRSTTGTPANAASYSIDVDSGGDVTFDSDASDLVSADTNGRRDVFRRFLNGDRSLGSVSLVSSLINGEQGDGDSSSPTIAGGGNYIAFATDATNLSGRSDCNGARDIIVRDYLLTTVRRVNLSTSGYQASSGFDSDAPAISYGGFLVAYATEAPLRPTDDNDVVDIYASVASEDPSDRDNPLTSEERLDEPPDICVAGRAVSVFMERFSEVSTSSVSAQARNSSCPPKGLCYTTQLTPLGRTARLTDALRKVGKRNQATFRNLPPGTYRCSFRVSGKRGSTTITTNRSPNRTITVPRRS